jgi:CVNH domain-containing protein
MSQLRLKTKLSLIAGAAMVLSFAAPELGHAQGAPRGSYLRTCTDVATRGNTLVAHCRRADGSWGRTVLRDVDRCVGDIGNVDGQLACNRGERDFGRRARDYRHSPGYDYSYDGRGRAGDGSSLGGWSPERHWPPAGYPSDYGR